MSDPALADDVVEVAAHLDAIRRVLRTSIWAAARALPVPLTAPQLLALQVLVDELRAGGGGLSLSSLSERMGLAHSTVSGIVDRLERQGLLERRRRAEDRRFVSIELTAPVRAWLEHELPAARRGPLELALERAGSTERARIVEALAALRRLLEASADPPMR